MNDQIMTPRQLFEWATANIPAAYFGYCSKNDYERKQQDSSNNFTYLVQYQAREKLHSFAPISKSKVRVIFFSAADTTWEERVTLNKHDVPLESVAGFVTCLSGGKWWLACVLEAIEADNLVKLTFLHPHGPSSSFKYPEPHDIRTVPMDNVLTLVDPRTRTGRVYTLSRKEVTCVSDKLRIVSK